MISSIKKIINRLSGHEEFLINKLFFNIINDNYKPLLDELKTTTKIRSIYKDYNNFSFKNSTNYYNKSIKISISDQNLKLNILQYSLLLLKERILFCNNCLICNDCYFTKKIIKNIKIIINEFFVEDFFESFSESFHEFIPFIILCSIDNNYIIKVVKYLTNIKDFKISEIIIKNAILHNIVDGPIETLEILLEYVSKHKIFSVFNKDNNGNTFLHIINIELVNNENKKEILLNKYKIIEKFKNNFFNSIIDLTCTNNFYNSPPDIIKNVKFYIY